MAAPVDRHAQRVDGRGNEGDSNTPGNQVGQNRESRLVTCSSECQVCGMGDLLTSRRILGGGAEGEYGGSAGWRWIARAHLTGAEFKLFDVYAGCGRPNLIDKCPFVFGSLLRRAVMGVAGIRTHSTTLRHCTAALGSTVRFPVRAGQAKTPATGWSPHRGLACSTTPVQHPEGRNSPRVQPTPTPSPCPCNCAGGETEP